MFRTSTPVTDGAFHDRAVELDQLTQRVDQLRAGAPRWLAVLGVRRVGKTSLLLELVRRNRHKDVRFVVLDTASRTNRSGSTSSRRLALRTVDAFFGRELGVSLEELASRPDDYRATLPEARAFAGFDRALRADLLSLCVAPGQCQDRGACARAGGAARRGDQASTAWSRGTSSRSSRSCRRRAVAC